MAKEETPQFAPSDEVVVKYMGRADVYITGTEDNKFTFKKEEENLLNVSKSDYEKYLSHDKEIKLITKE